MVRGNVATSTPSSNASPLPRKISNSYSMTAKPATRPPMSTTKPKDRPASIAGAAKFVLELVPSPPARPVKIWLVGSLVAEAVVELDSVSLGLDGFRAPHGLSSRQLDAPIHRGQSPSLPYMFGSPTFVVAHAAVLHALVPPLLADEVRQSQRVPGSTGVSIGSIWAAARTGEPSERLCV